MLELSILFFLLITYFLYESYYMVIFMFLFIFLYAMIAFYIAKKKKSIKTYEEIKMVIYTYYISLLSENEDDNYLNYVDKNIRKKLNGENNISSLELIYHNDYFTVFSQVIASEKENKQKITALGDLLTYYPYFEERSVKELSEKITSYLFFNAVIFLCIYIFDYTLEALSSADNYYYIITLLFPVYVLFSSLFIMNKYSKNNEITRKEKNQRMILSFFVLLDVYMPLNALENALNNTERYYKVDYSSLLSCFQREDKTSLLEFNKENQDYYIREFSIMLFKIVKNNHFHLFIWNDKNNILTNFELVKETYSEVDIFILVSSFILLTSLVLFGILFIQGY